MRRATIGSQSWQQQFLFQSTLSVRRATCDKLFDLKTNIWFQSTLSVRRATRLMSSAHQRRPWFQSTLSVRRATNMTDTFNDMSTNFNPRSPWGERLVPGVTACNSLYFNPRSPWGERRNQRLNQTIKWLFQSTLSVRRATWHFDYTLRNSFIISIHALREESDRFSHYELSKVLHFNPRSPWGERQALCHNNARFQTISIHALREESDFDFFQFLMPVKRISIHALREESDPLRLICKSTLQDFNPRSPWGERLNHSFPYAG